MADKGYKDQISHKKLQYCAKKNPKLIKEVNTTADCVKEKERTLKHGVNKQSNHMTIHHNI